MLDFEQVTPLAQLGLGAACLWAVPWGVTLMHELGHAAAAVVCGGRILQAQVGTGVSVASMRAFGARWELRLRPTHGQVTFVLPFGNWYRARILLVALAGPLVSTAVGGGILWWLLAGGGFAALSAASLYVALPATLMVAIAWLPIQVRLAGGGTAASDVLVVWNTLRQPLPDREHLQEAQRQLLAGYEAWEAFLSGAYRDALELHRANESAAPASAADPAAFEWVARGLLMALYTWPVHGAAAALIEHTRADAMLTELEAMPLPSGDNGRIVRQWRRTTRLMANVNRVFFGAVDGDPEQLAAIDAIVDPLAEQWPRDPAVQRTCGLALLHLGRVRAGMNRLRNAWRQPEPAWLRSLCALYLAFGHALEGDQARARRMLRRARRLHAHNALLADYGQRIDALLAPAARGGRAPA